MPSTEPDLPPLVGEDMGGLYDREAYAISMDARRAHIFRYRWLKKALTAEEYAATEGITTDLLINLYPNIYAGGPAGEAQYRNIRRTLAIAQNQVPGISAEKFLNDLASTYLDEIVYDKEYNRLETCEERWYAMSTGEIMIDSDGWYEGLLHWWGELNTELFVADQQKHQRIMTAIDERITLINLASMGSEPELQTQLRVHRAFTERYGLG